MQNKRSPIIRESDVFSIRLFYAGTSCVIMFDCNYQKSRNLPDQSLISAPTITTAIAMTYFMITIETENYNYISQDFYNNTIDSIDLTQITCTCGLSGSLIFYGSYKRKVQLPDEVLILTVARVRCLACGHTHALLLSSIVPYSQIPVVVQIDTIAALEEGVPLDSVLSGQCCVDESNLRSIIRSYRLHWKERLLSENIKLTPFSLLIRSCFSCFARSFMQIKNTRNKLFPAPT